MEADADGTLTRSPFVSTVPTSLSPLTADAYVSVKSGDYSAASWWNPGNVATTFTTPADAGFNTDVEWPEEERPIYTTALSPSGAWTYSDAGAKFVAPLSSAVDLMVSPETKTLYKRPVSLHFKHATIFVQVFMNSAPEVTQEWGLLENLSISKLNGSAKRPKELVYQVATRALSASTATTTAPLPFCIARDTGVSPVYTDTLLTNAGIDVRSTRFRLVGYAMARGAEDGLGQTEIVVECQNQSRATTVDLTGIGYGKGINIYLTLQPDGITLRHEIAAWNKVEGAYNDPDKDVHILTLSSGRIDFGYNTQTYDTPENLLKVTTSISGDPWKLTIPTEARWLNARVGPKPEHGLAQEAGSTETYEGTNYICFLAEENDGNERSCVIMLSSPNDILRLEVEVHQKGVPK
ncbi:MAG: hypothetical protein LBN29_13270 [Mediterranea sp.]|jgi:hypothetical protein|nr:hypothetical protein [Mediterranea sp.]